MLFRSYTERAPSDAGSGAQPPLTIADPRDLSDGAAELVEVQKSEKCQDDGQLLQVADDFLVVKLRRSRDKEHLRFIATQPCTVCGRQPCEAHHIRYAQSRALGRKVSDEFTVPLCRVHHRELHRQGNEHTWWATFNIDPLPIALRFWQHTRRIPNTQQATGEQQNSGSEQSATSPNR